MKIEYEEKEIVREEGGRTKTEKVEEMKVVKKEQGGGETVLETVPKMEDVVGDGDADGGGVQVEVKRSEERRVGKECPV